MARLPTSGRIVPELPATEAREIIFGTYRIFYRVETGRVHIIAVQHSRQELDFHSAEPRIRLVSDASVEELLQDCSPEVRDLTLRSCELIRRVFPGAWERVHASWKVIAFGKEDGTMKGMVFGVVPLRGRVNIQLPRISIEDPAGLLEGSGSAVRHIRVMSADTLQDPALETLLRMSAKLAE